MTTVSLDKSARAAIVARRRSTLDRRIADRLSMLLWLADGRTQDEVARLLGYTPRQIRKWLRRYRDGSLDALCQLGYHGNPGKLSKGQIEHLKTELTTGRFHCAQQACDWVADTFGVVYSARGMRDLLRRNQVSYHKATAFFWTTREAGSPSDPVKQEEHLRKHERQKQEAQGKKTRRYYVDACHPVWGIGLLYSCWLPVGRRFLVGVGGGRKRVNILGAYCPDDQDYLDIRLTRDNINGQQFINLLRLMKDSHPDTKTFILYLDNAKYYHCEVVKKWLDDHREFQLEPLPAYSPNLNLIERLWKFLKKEAFRRWHKTFDEMVQAVSDVLDHLHKYRAELSTLMVEKFQKHPNAPKETTQTLAA